MKLAHLTVALATAGMLIAAPAFADSTTPAPAKQTKNTHQVHKQKTDGEDVTGNNNFSSSSLGAKKQRTDGEDVTGNNNFSSSSLGAKKQRTDGEDVTGNNNFAPRSK